MAWQGWVQIAVFAAPITAAVKPVGAYIASIFERPKIPRPFAALENGLYRLAGVDPAQEQSWVSYALSLIWFHLAGIALLYTLQRMQNVLPINPQEFDAVGPDLALNTAVSFATNTSFVIFDCDGALVDNEIIAGETLQSISRWPRVFFTPHPEIWYQHCPAVDLDQGATRHLRWIKSRCCL